jgi:hypothetical protein
MLTSELIDKLATIDQSTIIEHPSFRMIVDEVDGEAAELLAWMTERWPGLTFDRAAHVCMTAYWWLSFWNGMVDGGNKDESQDRDPQCAGI